jgi:hypothetical protein
MVDNSGDDPPIRKRGGIARLVSGFLYPRRWWMPLLILSVALLMLSLWCRSLLLLGLPDIPEPFDIDAVAHVEVPAEQNAFERYRVASDELRPLPAELQEEFRDVIQQGWLALPEAYRECARQRLLETTLALQVYRREEGTYPESLDQLVGRGLEALPVDPFGKGEPLHFRREPDAADGVTLWSIGDDVDDDGRVELTHDNSRGDIVVHIKPPAATVAD